MPRKRARSEMEVEEPVLAPQPAIPSTLMEIRQMWEFAALNQYLFNFGKAVKLEDMDVDDFEDECLKPGASEKLAQMGLQLLKNVSSHKGLTPEIFDEYTRRQFVAKAPKRNPYGTDEEPLRFNEFDIFTKIRVLQQLSVWTLNNPNTIRDKMDASENDQLAWRVEPFGWDADERTYFLLDDNRLYRRTDAPPPEEEEPKPKAKAKSKKGGRSARSNKRRRVSRTIPETSPEDDEQAEDNANGVDGEEEEREEPRMDDFCQEKWELIAVSMDEYSAFIDTIRKSRDPNEKTLRKQIEENVFPVLLEQEEERKRKEARRLKELEVMQKLATAKRSSRLAVKMDRVQEQKAAEEAEAKHKAELEMARREMQRAEQMEHAREGRRETREQRLREREAKRILEEERLQKEEVLLQELEAQGKDADAERARISERKLKADMQKRKKDLENLQQDDTWYFDCSVCGVHGQNLDDGSHSMACDKCSVWQHSKCHGVTEEQAEREDFHFLCQDCENKAKNPIKPLILKFNNSPKQPGTQGSPLMNGPSLSPHGQASGPPRAFSRLVYPGPPRPPPSQAPMKAGNGVAPNGQHQPLQTSYSQSPPQGLPRPYPSHSPPNGHGPPRNPPPSQQMSYQFDQQNGFPQYTSPPSTNGYRPPQQPPVSNPAPMSQNGIFNHYVPPTQPSQQARPPQFMMANQQSPHRAPTISQNQQAVPRAPQQIQHPSQSSQLVQPAPPPAQQSKHAAQAPPPSQPPLTAMAYPPASPVPNLRPPPHNLFTPNAQAHAQNSNAAVGSAYGSSPGYSPVKKSSPQVPAQASFSAASPIAVSQKLVQPQVQAQAPTPQLQPSAPTAGDSGAGAVPKAPVVPQTAVPAPNSS
ncbi:hypothetical protein EJ08DRAFT_651048 [Tothia fuscella]|uniref:PHD-type domain-containing protein n=1 Tax=Tothia fuscella TaxID=1048955 RepID=A0A9P4NMT2_9PEZI|nr:hypothetical protein EJ08DRAFT_651048 [Tothia fuscella]